jgi:hypothetical protein
MVYALCSLEGEDKTPELWSHGCDQDNEQQYPPCYCLFVAGDAAPNITPETPTLTSYEPHCRPSILLYRFATLINPSIDFDFRDNSHRFVTTSRRHTYKA